MKLRTEQLLEFERARFPGFEDSLVDHLFEFAPFYANVLDDSQLRAFIQVATERARRHGFTYGATIRFYVETAVLLGIDFDTDPQYPWAAESLAYESATDEVERADILWEELTDYIHAVAGGDRELSSAALKKTRSVALDFASQSQSDFTDRVIERLAVIHPEKVEYVGEDDLAELIQRAIAESHRFSITSDFGVLMFVGLMFVLGHGFASDPKFPWVGKVLINPAFTAADERASRLYSKAMLYLDSHLQKKLTSE